MKFTREAVPFATALRRQEGTIWFTYSKAILVAEVPARAPQRDLAPSARRSALEDARLAGEDGRRAERGARARRGGAAAGGAGLAEFTGPRSGRRFARRLALPRLLRAHAEPSLHARAGAGGRGARRCRGRPRPARRPRHGGLRLRRWAGAASPRSAWRATTSPFPVPPEMSDAEAAGFVIAFHTAWVGLVRRAALPAPRERPCWCSGRREAAGRRRCSSAERSARE